MQLNSLLESAINLTLFGMGFVFLFLILLVFTTQLMSFVVQKLHLQDNNDSADDLTPEDELDEETKFVIEQAIKMHRGS